MYVPLADWLARMESDYLSAFIPTGGAAVKFVITAPFATADDARRELEPPAARHDLAYLALDAATTRLHMIDQLFHGLARQVDWDAQAGWLVRRLLAADGFVLPEPPEPCHYARVAELSGSSEQEVRRRTRALLHDHVERDYAMVREFRLAMLRLCQAALDPNPAELAEIGAIHAWLTGELRQVSALKPAGIFQKIGRHLARDMFLSLAHWLRLTGKRGAVLVLDITRYALERRTSEQDGLLFYSTTAVVDAYEVLRQFIDATDELEGCLIVVIAPTAFLTDEKRGLIKYPALRLRIWDEVRDRRRANPLSSLVRLAGTGV
ncbi:MAG TPA: BREX system ATP-binding domain-containing protein [Chloroflexota bacterium]|nr:BREX system ATP-binding domain-containing protein [Chloroflexota bacterium]